MNVCGTAVLGLLDGLVTRVALDADVSVFRAERAGALTAGEVERLAARVGPVLDDPGVWDDLRVAGGAS